MNIRAFVLGSILTVTSGSMPAFAQNATPAVLAQQRVDAALRVLTHVTALYASGQATVDDVGTWAARWYQARRDTGLTGAALTTAAQEWFDKMNALVQVVTTRVQAGMSTAADNDKAAYYRLDAATQLARLKTP
jgi:hypothetical protein